MIQGQETKVTPDPRQAPYTKPKLSKIGEVKTLTMGVSGNGNDDGVMDSSPKQVPLGLPLGG